MKIKTYHIEFNSFREGKNYSLEQTVEAVDIYDAMKIVENYCYDNYGTCEITSVKKADKTFEGIKYGIKRKANRRFC